MKKCFTKKKFKRLQNMLLDVYGAIVIDEKKKIIFTPDDKEFHVSLAAQNVRKGLC